MEQCHFSYFRASQSLSPRRVAVSMGVMEGCLRCMYILGKLAVLCYLFSKPQNHFLSIYDPSNCLLWLYQKLVNAGPVYSQFFLMSYVSFSWILLFWQIKFWYFIKCVQGFMVYSFMIYLVFFVVLMAIWLVVYSSGWKNSYCPQEIVSISFSISFYYWFLLRMN